MPCRPISVDLEVDPSTTQQILFTLAKTCDDQDRATWKLSFELKEGNPLATVIKLKVEIGPENHPQAQATADAGGLTSAQQGQAKIAAAVAKDPASTDGDKNDAVQQVIASRELQGTAGGGQ